MERIRFESAGTGDIQDIDDLLAKKGKEALVTNSIHDE